MAATVGDIELWFDRGLELGATHMAIFMDTFDYEDYPVYVYSDESARTRVSENEDRLMEVYDLRRDKQEQLRAHRVFNY